MEIPTQMNIDAIQQLDKKAREAQKVARGHEPTNHVPHLDNQDEAQPTSGEVIVPENAPDGQCDTLWYVM